MNKQLRSPHISGTAHTAIGIYALMLLGTSGPTQWRVMRKLVVASTQPGFLTYCRPNKVRCSDKDILILFSSIRC